MFVVSSATFSFRLSPLFRAKSRVCAGNIHKRENRSRKLFRDLHCTQRLAVALGVREPEIAVDFLLHVPPLLRSQDQDLFTMKSRHATNHRWIIGVTTVAVNLAEVGEDFFYVVEEIGTLRMPRQFGLDPCFPV